MKILIFAFRVLSSGYGVDLVIKQLAIAWEEIGYEVFVGCIQTDLKSEKIKTLLETKESIIAYIKEVNPNFIYIHTFPFWKFLPDIKKEFSCPVIMHDYGDPTPELIENEFLKSFLKKQYPIRLDNMIYADGIICISEFVRTDVGYKNAEIVLLGSENIQDLGLKNTIPKKKLKIGMLGRIGVGENDYKGLNYFIQLAKTLGFNNYDFYFSGHGEKVYSEKLIEAGFIIKLNLTEDEKVRYLRDLDIFISTSLWEGFNLPLLEAQALGTLSLAFDVGAHPEVTIFNFGSVVEMCFFIEQINLKRELLLFYSNCCYTFARSRFSWIRAAHQILKISIKNKGDWAKLEVKNRRGIKNIIGIYFYILRLIKDEGFFNTFIYLFKRKFFRRKR